MSTTLFGDIVCPHCKLTMDLDDAEIGGACEGNLICPKCAEEFDAVTCETAVRCGECEFCVDGEYLCQFQ